ncbi:MAG: hypothetical protein RL018_1321, partial [Pseudomonadota bacterium]
MSKEAMTLALEALEDLGMKHFESTGEVLHKEVFDVLKEALAKQEQGGWYTHDLYTDADKDIPDVICDRNGQVVLGLCKRCGRGEAELETPCDKPKQEQGEPVAWMKEQWSPDCGPYVEIYRDDEMGWRDPTDWTPLYTKPQQRTAAEGEDTRRAWVGLTDREKSNLWLESRAAIPRFHTYASLVEAKLKE